MSADEGPACGVCGDESGGAYVGIAAVPGAPVSLGWCRNCLGNNAVPRFVAEAWLFGGFAQADEPIPGEAPNPEVFADWVRGFTIWLDGQYVPFVDAVPRLWEEELRERAASCGESR